MLLIVYFVLSFSFAFVSLAVSLHYLNHHDANLLPLLWATVSIPWICKPLFGAVIDRVPLGSKWIAIGFVLAAVAFALVPVSVHFLVVASACMCTADVACDALMVVVSRSDKQIQRQSLAAREFGRVVGTLLGGGMYLYWGYQTVMFSVTGPLLATSCMSLSLPNGRAKCSAPKWSWSLFRLQMVGFLLSATPNVDTFLLLTWRAGGMTALDISFASITGQLGALAGLWLGKGVRRDICVWTAAITSMSISMSASITHLAPMWFALFQNFLGGLGSAMFLSAFIEAVTPALQKGSEAFSYAAVMAACNLGGVLASAMESWLMGASDVKSSEDNPAILVTASVLLTATAWPVGLYFQTIRSTNLELNEHEQPASAIQPVVSSNG